MRHTQVGFGLLVFVVLGAAGCGAPSSGNGRTTAASSATPSTAATPAASLPADLDQGPRAGESAYDESQAEAGEALFSSKGCSACHAFGKRVTGPDLAGVSMRRTARWMESQILHPDLMVKQDPTARALFAQYALQMPKQGLTPEEARSVIEYFKHMDHEGREAGKEKH